MTVLQNYYQDKDEYRRGEIDLCLQKNVENPYISKIILIVETEARPSIESDKIEIVEWHRRPTYTDCFQIANEKCGDGEIVAICNSDIYFNHTISLAFNITDDECYALSRWDDIHGQLKPFHHSDSQDVWIMRTPIANILNTSVLGVPGCDNRIAFLLNEAGYKLTNPCKSIYALHIHGHSKHNYTAADRVAPPYLRVNPE
jgi:hypothetical protein